jgi:CheY-like chemotaxis protein
MAAPFAILVVEDELLIRLNIVEELRGCGFAVLEAGNAAEAIDILGSRCVMLAVHNGVETAFDRRDNYRSKLGPVKVLSDLPNVLSAPTADFALVGIVDDELIDRNPL